MAPRDTFTAAVPNEVESSESYLQWEEVIDGSHFDRIEAAVEKIRTTGVITNVKDLGNGLYEKKWVMGLRLYFAVIEKQGRKTLLLLGSGKGKEQARAIQQARMALNSYQVIRGSILKKD